MTTTTEIYRNALERIAKGEGRFSRDPLTHAANTIEDMQNIATNVLKMSDARWREYDMVAEDCAKNDSWHHFGDPLPENVSSAVHNEIYEHPDEFEERVSRFAYAVAMAEIHNEDPE